MKLYSLAVLCSMTVLAACGPTKYVVQSTPLAIGADADILAQAEKEQGIIRLTVDARNLPPPGRLKDGLTHFVCWQRSDGGSAWKRVAALAYDESSRRGKLEDVSVASTAFDLEITAENGPAVEAPSDTVIFVQRVTP